MNLKMPVPNTLPFTKTNMYYDYSVTYEILI